MLLLQFLLKWWKELILVCLVAIFFFTTLLYKGKYEDASKDSLLLRQQVEIANQQALVEQERIKKEQQVLLATLESRYRDSMEQKQSEINQLESFISSSNSRFDSLLKTVRDTTTSTSPPTITKETIIRHVDVFGGLYEESLRNGREASETVERTKIAYTQCMNDVDSIYKSVNQYNLRVNQYNLRVTEQNTNLENKE